MKLIKNMIDGSILLLPQNKKERRFLKYLFEIIPVDKAEVMPSQSIMNCCSQIDHPFVAIGTPAEQSPEKFVPHWIRPVLTKQEKTEDGF